MRSKHLFHRVLNKGERVRRSPLFTAQGPVLTWTRFSLDVFHIFVHTFTWFMRQFVVGHSTRRFSLRFMLVNVSKSYTHIHTTQLPVCAALLGNSQSCVTRNSGLSTNNMWNKVKNRRHRFVVQYKIYKIWIVFMRLKWEKTEVQATLMYREKGDSWICAKCD